MRIAESVPRPFVVICLIGLAIFGYATIECYQHGEFDYARYDLAVSLVILLSVTQNKWVPYLGAHNDWLYRQSPFVRTVVPLMELAGALVIVLWFGVGTSALTRGW